MVIRRMISSVFGRGLDDGLNVGFDGIWVGSNDGFVVGLNVGPNVECVGFLLGAMFIFYRLYFHTFPNNKQTNHWLAGIHSPHYSPPRNVRYIAK